MSNVKNLKLNQLKPFVSTQNLENEDKIQKKQTHKS